MESMERSSRKVRTGIVVSDAREKTVTVAIELQFPHPKYKKIVKKTRKLHAHDESFEAKVGDTVKIMETKPFSKTKKLLAVCQKVASVERSEPSLRRGAQWREGHFANIY